MDPSEWMTTRMAKWARLETPAPKGPGESTGDALARWDAQARAELGRSSASVWNAAIHAARPTVPAIGSAMMTCWLGWAGGRSGQVDLDPLRPRPGTDPEYSRSDRASTARPKSRLWITSKRAVR